ncbi:MAG: hypothetical protein U0869_24525 [Chloroflexota bacterium]
MRRGIAAVLAVVLLVGSSVNAEGASPAPSGSPVPGPAASVAPGTATPIDLEHPMAGPDVLPTDQASVDLVAAIRAPEYGPATRDAVVAALAANGIAVVDDATLQPLVPVTEPASPLRFLASQAGSMALEAWGGSGVTGAALDAAIKVPKKNPRASWLLAGWLAAADTQRGRLARALMAGQDVSVPADLVVPSLVTALLVADLAADGPPSATGTAPRVAALAVRPPAGVEPRTADAGLCTGAQQFIDDVIAAVFTRLQASVPKSGAGVIVASAWNWLVGKAQAFVRGLVAELTAPVLSVIRTIAGALATITEAVRIFVPWTVTIQPTPSSVLVLPVDPAQGVQGTFTLRVSAGDVPEWPAFVADCAAAAGVQLPSLKPIGEPVAWKDLANADGLLIRDGAQVALDDQGVAKIDFHSITETPEQAKGAVLQTPVKASATVTRSKLKQFGDTLAGTLFGQVPAVVRPLVDAAARPIITGLIARLSSLFDTTAMGSLVVVHHQKPEPSASPQESVPPTTVSDPVMATKANDFAAWTFIACDGPYGTWKGGWSWPTFGFQLKHHFTIGGGAGTVSVVTHPPKKTFRVGAIDVKMPVDLTITITDGKTFTMQGLNSVTGKVDTITVPIVPAPAGSCP